MQTNEIDQELIAKADEIDFKNESERIAKKLLLKKESQQALDRILKTVDQKLQAPVIKNYNFFLKAKRIINKKMADIINQLTLPKYIKNMFINYINYKPVAPSLKKYLNPEVLKNHQNELVKEKYFSINLFANQLLTAQEGLEYAIDYIQFVCGGNENIKQLILSERLITITVKDLSKIIWSIEAQQDIYQFSENYLFNRWDRYEFLTEDIERDKKIFEDIKAIVNIETIDNYEYRLCNYWFSNSNKIKIQLSSSDEQINKTMFQKLQQAVINEKQQDSLMKSAMKTIKDQIYLKNDWQKYDVLKISSEKQEDSSLNNEICYVADRIGEKAERYIKELKEKKFTIENGTLKDQKFYVWLYFEIKDKIREFIWEKIDEKIEREVLKKFYINQANQELNLESQHDLSVIQESDPMNQMWNQYESNNSK